MKVFTNTNFATGKAKAKILENRIVGLDTTDGRVIQAIADTVPIGVSHNYAAEADCPITVIPLGGGFARITAGMGFGVADLGVMVGPDANGCAVSTPTYSVGILAGLSADVEGAVEAEEGDDVVVLLCGCGGIYPDPKGTARFQVLDGEGLAVAGVLVTITIPGEDDLTGETDAEGVVEFRLDEDTYAWAAEKDGYELDVSADDVTVEASTTTVVEITATKITQGTVEFEVLKDSVGVDEADVTIMLLGEIVDSDATNSSGIVSFDLEEGDYTWAVDIDAYVYDFDPDSGPVTVTAGKTEEVKITAASTQTQGSVRFIVGLNDKTPVEGVEIVISKDANPVETKTTGANGIAKFKLDAETYNWAATLEDYTLTDASGTVTITIGSVASDVEITAALTNGG